MTEFINIAEEIKNRADIVDVIGRTVKLRKRGSLWEGLCPFHNEKTPSFKVYENTQHYHCYGCGLSGDVITFYQKLYNLDFIEAAVKLCDEYGINWKPGGGGGIDRSAYYEFNREAAIFYHNELSKDGSPGMKYLSERGLSDKVLRKFGLGYAPGEKKGLSAHLKDKKANLDKAVEIGLVLKDGQGYKDRYYNRVMFPIINTRNNVIGFGARAIDPKSEPKYINSSESKIFLKKNNLYGINLSKDVIAKERTAIFVEGYMDVISLYQQGIRNVTASLGTALTPFQAKLMKRFADNVVLAYDSDEAGRKAALKGIDVLRKEGLNVKVLVLPEGSDPDDYVSQFGKEAFMEVVSNAVPATEFKLTNAKKNYDFSEKEAPVSYLKEAAVILRDIDPVEADYYIGWLEEDTGISAGSIRMQIYGSEKPETQGKQIQDRKTATNTVAPALQKEIIRLLVHDSSFISKIDGREHAFSDAAIMRIYISLASLVKAVKDDGEEPGTEQLLESLEDEDRAVLKGILENVFVSDEPQAQFFDCMTKLDLMELKAEKQGIIDALSVSIDEKETRRLNEELQKLLDREKKIEKKGG